MKTYYVYGRKEGIGFISQNPEYTKSDEDQYFVKMTGYLPVRDEQGQEIRGNESPEKYYLYNIDSEEKGPALIWGKSLQAAPNKFSDSNRYTDFSHQIIFSDEDREKALTDISAVLDNRSFYGNLQQFYEGSLDVQPDLSQMSDNLPQQLLAMFGMDKRRLRELLYAALCFNRGTRVYIMLPENSKRGTDGAVALMKRLYSLLPVCILARTGFVTYVSAVSDDYISSGTGFIFLAVSPKNEHEMKKNGQAYCFAPFQRETNVEIPENLNALIDLMESAFMTGFLDEKLERFYGALERYLKDDSRDAISDAEYEGLYFFSRHCTILNDYINKRDTALDEKKVWENIDLVRLMLKKRSFLWNENLDRDLFDFETAFICYGSLTENDTTFNKIISEYKEDLRLQDATTDFFAKRIRTADDMARYMEILLDCEPLRLAVSARMSTLIESFLRSGTVDSSLYSLVMDYYLAGEINRELIEDFFASKCTDADSYEQIKKFCISHKDKNGEILYPIVKEKVYNNPENLSFVVMREKKKIKNAYAQYAKWGCAECCNQMWKIVKEKNSANINLAENSVIYTNLTFLIKQSIESETAIKLAVKALECSLVNINELGISDTYYDFLENLSREYLQNSYDRIFEDFIKTENPVKWPLVSADDLVLHRLQTEVNSYKNTFMIQKKFKDQTIGTSKDIIRGLKRIRDESEINVLRQNSEFLDKEITRILKKVNVETEGKRNRKEKERDFDQLHALLLLYFPSEAPVILGNIMEAAQGGILSVLSVYDCVFGDSNLGFSETEILKNEMKNAIVAFFESHELGKEDVRAIKKYGVLMKKNLGINPNLILRK